MTATEAEHLLIQLDVINQAKRNFMQSKSNSGGRVLQILEALASSRHSLTSFRATQHGSVDRLIF